MRWPHFIGVAALLLSSFFAMPLPADSTEDILVITNLSADSRALTVEEVKRYFLKKRQKWPNGQKAIPIHAKAGTNLRDDFVSRVLQMSKEEEVLYWKKYQIEKGVSVPPEFGNTQKAVFKLKGSISYIYRSEHKDQVNRVILVVKAP